MSRILLLFLLSLVLSRAFWRLIGGVIAGLNAAPPTGSSGRQQAVHMQRDPVCGTFVVPSTALVLTDGSRKVYFCSTACRDAYRSRTT